MDYSNIFSAAAYYVSLGWPIIPFCPADEASHNRTSPGHKRMCKCPGKVPIIAGWQQKKETDLAELDSWKASFGNFNIGLPLGSASGYVGIDVDGAEGEELLECMSDNDLPETWEYSTGDGRRLIYSIPVGMPTKKYKQTGDSKHSECAILCDGQATILPPSLHYTGKVYTWVTGKSPYDLDCCMAPKWLIDLILHVPKETPKMNLLGKGAAVMKYTVDMTKIENEFVSTEFVDYIPEELKTMDQTEVKGQVKKEVSVDASDTQKILRQVVSEGGRDDAMTKVIGYFLSRQGIRDMGIETFTASMLQYNTQFMDPPLDDEVVLHKIAFFWEIEAQKSAEYKGTVDSKREFIPDQMAQVCLNLFKEQKNLLIDIESGSGRCYTCNANKGPWNVRSGDYLQDLSATIRTYITSEQYGDPTWGFDAKIREVMSAMKDNIRSNTEQQDRLFDLESNQALLQKFIPVDGKLLDWKNKELKPWDPEVRATYSFDIGYDPEAKCPHWLEYMEQWIPDEGSRRLVQEFFGLALIPDTSMPVVLFLDGHGSNGKSVMLGFFIRLFKGICSTYSTTKLTERFGAAGLLGKLINICTEDEGDGNGYLKHPALIKALSSGDVIRAEFKGQDGFDFKNAARMVFATNKMPKVKDNSDGWARRMRIVKFPNRFKPDSTVAERMEANMQKELSGIFNWLIEGLQGIKSRGNFAESEVMLENKEEYKALNNATEKFRQQCLRPMDDIIDKTTKKRIGISSKVLYALYTAWILVEYGENGTRYKKVQKNFVAELQVLGLNKDTGACCIMSGKPTQVFLRQICEIRDIDVYTGIMEILEPDALSNIPEGHLYRYLKSQEARRAEWEENIEDLEE